MASRSKMRRNLSGPILFIGVVAAIALRLHVISASTIWFDELFSIHASSKPWIEMLRFVALDLIHPPLFYIVLKLWIGVAGTGVSTLRILPLAFFFAALLPIDSILRNLKQHFSIRILAVYLVIFSGSLLKYSVELRMYSLLLLLSAISIWLFLRSVEKGLRFWPVAAVNLMLVYTHYFGWFVLTAELLMAVILLRKQLPKVVLMIAFCGAGFVPWIVAVFANSSAGSGLDQNIGWMSRPGLREVITFLFTVIEPVYYQVSSAEPVSNLAITLPLLLTLICGSIVGTVNQRGQSRSTKSEILILAGFTLIPIALAFTISWVSPYSIWGTRHLIEVFIPAYILVAVMIGAISSRFTRQLILAASFACLTVAVSLGFFRNQPQTAWGQIGPILNDRSNNTAAIYTTEDLIAYHAWFELRQTNSTTPVKKIDGITGITEDKAYFLPRGFDEIARVSVEGIHDDHVCLLFRAKLISESEPPLRNIKLLGYETLEAHVVPVDGEQLALYCFGKN